MELFYDIYGGTMIGGVWNPLLKSAEQQPWRVFLRFSSLPLGQGVQLKVTTFRYTFPSLFADQLPSEGEHRRIFKRGGYLVGNPALWGRNCDQNYNTRLTDQVFLR